MNIYKTKQKINLWYSFPFTCACISVHVTTKALDVKGPPQPRILRNSLMRFMLFNLRSDSFVSCSTWNAWWKTQAAALCSLSHKRSAMPRGYLHIQWLLLNVQVRMGGIRMGNAEHVVSHPSQSHWRGPLYSLATRPHSAEKVDLVWQRELWLVRQHCSHSVRRPPPPILPGQERIFC